MTNALNRIWLSFLHTLKRRDSIVKGKMQNSDSYGRKGVAACRPPPCVPKGKRCRLDRIGISLDDLPLIQPMWEILEILLHFWSAWRLALCLFLAGGCAVLCHTAFPDQDATCLISAPIVIAGIVVGLLWEVRAQ